jgi:hypothetical protein
MSQDVVILPYITIYVYIFLRILRLPIMILVLHYKYSG